MHGYWIEFRTRGRTRSCSVWAANSSEAIEAAKLRYHYGVRFRSLTKDPPCSETLPAGQPAAS